MISLFKRTHGNASRAGVAIADREIALTVVKRRAGARPLLVHCATHESITGSVDQMLGEALQEHALTRTPLSAVIDASGYQLVQMEAPSVEPEEWRAAIRWRLRDVIDFALDAASIDVFEIPEPARGAQARMLYAVAARNEAIGRVLDLIAPNARGFDVIDIPELCLRNLSTLLPQDQKGVALLLLGQRFHHLVLTRNGLLYVTRRIEISSRADIELDGAAKPRDMDASSLALELQRSLDYYESHFDQSPISDLLIAPGGDRALNLAAALRNEIGLKISTFNLADVVDLGENVQPPNDWLSLISAGAALRMDNETA